jgi:hypothetical protein
MGGEIAAVAGGLGIGIFSEHTHVTEPTQSL